MAFVLLSSRLDFNAMNRHTDSTRGFTLIEFFLSSVALFLLAIIILPLIQEFVASSQKAKILRNLAKIEHYAELYFEESDASSVSLYQLVGPKKKIPKLESIVGESYPKVIFRYGNLAVDTEKFGRIHLE